MTTGRRRSPKKPKGKEGLCWAWRSGHKARGLAARKIWQAGRGRGAPVSPACRRGVGALLQARGHEQVQQGPSEL